jgi:hypothetical protein
MTTYLPEFTSGALIFGHPFGAVPNLAGHFNPDHPLARIGNWGAAAPVPGVARAVLTLSLPSLPGSGAIGLNTARADTGAR